LEYSELDITKIKSEMIKDMKRGVTSPTVFDPKEEYKEAKEAGIDETIVSYERIERLASWAERMYNRYL
jgi:hypothetical protein